MKLHVTDEAAAWYKTELELTMPNQIRLYPRYGGVGGIIPGFSLGISHDEPYAIFASRQVDDLLFFIEDNDAWYFGEHNLTIQYNKEMNEPEFIYET